MVRNDFQFLISLGTCSLVHLSKNIQQILMSFGEPLTTKEMIIPRSLQTLILPKKQKIKAQQIQNEHNQPTKPTSKRNGRGIKTRTQLLPS